MSTPPTTPSPASTPAPVMNAVSAQAIAISGPAKAFGWVGTGIALLVGAILVLGGLGQSPARWTLIAIQFLPLGAAVVVVATIRGRNTASPAMAMLCAAGTLVAAAGLSQLSSGPVVALNQPMRTWTLLMMVAGAFLTLSAALSGLGSDHAARARAFRGMLWAIPLVAVIALAVTPQGQAISSKLGGLPSFVRVAAYLIAALGASISLCVSLELLVTAFQLAQRNVKAA